MNSIDNQYLKRIYQINAFNSDESMNGIRDFYYHPSFWQIMKIARRENQHSDFIAYYLNPDNQHSLDDIFLKKLLSLITIKAIEQGHQINDDLVSRLVVNPRLSDISISREEYMEGDSGRGRFDIFISGTALSSHGSMENIDFLVTIENKISAAETKGKDGVGQTKKYKDYVDSIFPNHEKLYVLLSPNNDTSVESEDFIRISYQDLLNNVIEPIISTPGISRCDKDRLTDYVKCLSAPALEGSTNQKNKYRTTIMAISEQEKNLLMDFWEKNEDLIKACLSVIATNEDFSEEVREVASKASSTNYQKDTTQYTFTYKGTSYGPYPKSRLALEICRCLLQDDRINNIWALNTFITAVKPDGFNYTQYQKLTEGCWIATGIWRPQTVEKLKDWAKTINVIIKP